MKRTAWLALLAAATFGACAQPSPEQQIVETVDEELVLTDRTMTVNLYHIAGNPHSDRLLMVYFPRERLLVEADVFNPGAAVSPYATNLGDNIKKRNLRIDRFVPLHAKIVPYAEFTKVVPATSTN